MKKDRIKELNYEQLLLLHLNRIGKLTASIMGEVTLAGGSIMHSRKEDKEEAIQWSVKFFDALIPKELREKYQELEKELNNCETEMDKVHTYMNLLVKNGYFLDQGVVDDMSLE